MTDVTGNRKVALVSDLSGLGRCSLTAAISVLAAMGLSPCPVPTAILSAQTGFADYVATDFTEHAGHILDSWQKNGFTFGGICTGFMTGSEQVRRLAVKVVDIKKASGGCPLLVDPVMGDGGRAFPFADQEMIRAMLELTRQADVIVPNETELYLLAQAAQIPCENTASLSGRKTGGETSGFSAVQKQLVQTARALSKRAVIPQTVIVTGIRDEQAGEIVNLLVPPEGEGACCRSVYVPGSFSGTGDLLAAAVAGAMVAGRYMEDVAKNRLLVGALEAVGRMIVSAVSSAIRRGLHRNEGVDYEPYLKEMQDVLWMD